jgi:hypothetical protein
VQIDDGGCDGSRLRKKYELGLWFTAAGLGALGKNLRR